MSTRVPSIRKKEINGIRLHTLKKGLRKNLKGKEKTVMGGQESTKDEKVT